MRGEDGWKLIDATLFDCKSKPPPLAVVVYTIGCMEAADRTMLALLPEKEKSGLFSC